MRRHRPLIPADGQWQTTRKSRRKPADGYTYEVVDMDGMRVDKVLVTPPAAAEEREDK